MKDKKHNGVLRIGVLYDPEDHDLICPVKEKLPPLIKPKIKKKKNQKGKPS